MLIHAQINGVTPLLMARFTEDQLAPNRSKSKTRTIEEMAEDFAYRNKKGALYIPGQNLFRCIIEGGRFSKDGKGKITTMKNSLICAGCMMLSEECLLNTKTYKIFKTSAVNQAIKARIMTYRPMFEDWKLEFTLEVDEELFASNTIKKVIQDAGKRIGLGAWRPDTKGTYGKFEIVKFEVEEKK